MRPLEKRLNQEGYAVHNIGYPSRSEPPDELVRHLQGSLDECCLESGDKLHFVTHSLGGVLARAVLADQRPRALGRVVMIAPPNKGTELVDAFGDDWWFRLFLGPTAETLGTGHTSFPRSIGPPDYELGIIAGAHPLSSRMGAWIVTGENDGVVSVESTRVEGMTDFLAVPVGHVRIRDDGLVADEVVFFLRKGRFENGEQRQTSNGNQP
ncbi:MAG: alpha/beta hydrolase [bacterium]|nr:alpha/beta hydrolase [bacterium]MCP5069190.1 alpha/beta hydrolase [bacterium]